jgi:uncharacterized protein (TIGR02246 family)
MNLRLVTHSIVAIVCVASPVQAQSAKDEAAIRALAESWEQAWNRHDVKALGALFTDDADFVNVGAKHWRGRKEIVAKHAATLPQFSESTWSTSAVEVHFITPNISIVHVSWGLRGDKNQDGSAREPREGAFMWVAVRKGGNWLIRAAQNTNRSSTPEPQVPK